MKRLLTTSVLLFLNAQHVHSEPKYPTGPYSDEASYIAERSKNTVKVKNSIAVGLINAVELKIDDQVVDQCWTNVAAVKARISAELERSNIAVYNEALIFNLPNAPILEFKIIGFRVGTHQCVGNITTSVHNFSTIQVGSLGYTKNVYMIEGKHVMWTRSALHSANDTLDTVAMSSAQESIDNLISNIFASRREDAVNDFRVNFPQDKPMTISEIRQNSSQ